MSQIGNITLDETTTLKTLTCILSDAILIPEGCFYRSHHTLPTTVADFLLLVIAYDVSRLAINTSMVTGHVIV